MARIKVLQGLVDLPVSIDGILICALTFFQSNNFCRNGAREKAPCGGGETMGHRERSRMSVTKPATKPALNLLLQKPVFLWLTLPSLLVCRC